MKKLLFFKILGEEMKKIMKKAAPGSGSVKSKTKKKPAAKAKTKTAEPGSLKKQYLKKNPSCKVTFRLPKEAAPDAQVVSIVGDFNNWSITENKMAKLKNGDFKLVLELPCDREYKFRYLIDTNRWENDWFADKYIPNGYGSDDSVLVIGRNGS